MSVEKIILEELTDLKDRIADNIQSTGRNASGRTVKSMHIETRAQGGTLFGRSYFGTLETGRKPGKTPERFTEVIKQWVIDKGISYAAIEYKRKESAKWKPKYTPQERGLNSFASAVAMSIRNKGTRLYREGGSSDVYSKEIPKTIKAIQRRTISLMADLVNVEHLKLNK